MNRLNLLIIGIVVAMATIATPARGDVFGDEDLAPLQLTPAIPGGQPFDTPVELPVTPEPGCLLLGSGLLVILSRRHVRRLA